MQTPIAPGAQPLPCAFQTACRMHLRTPSRERSARPRFGSSCGSEYLRVHVLAAPAFQDQLDLDLLVVLPLLDVNDRRTWPEVIARVLAGQRVHRIGSQLPAPGRFGHGLANLLLHEDLIGADRSLHFERRHAGVLADRTFIVRGQVDVLGDHGQRLRGLRPCPLAVHGHLHRSPYIRWKIRGGAHDEGQHAVEEG